MKNVHSRKLAYLNRKVIYCDFVSTHHNKFPVQCFEAEYFGFFIKIMEINTHQDKFLYVIFIENQTDIVKSSHVLYTNRQFGYESLDDVIHTLNHVIKQRPFTILKYHRGRYQLLDPNGYDYIGQYVTKADAIRTSDGNFKYSE